MRSVLYISILIFLGYSALTAQETQNVFILVIDGARYSETFGDPSHQYIPHIWNELTPLGALYTSVYNQGVTLTNSGHSSILTGTWQSISNDGSERPHQPTLFEYFRKEKATSSTDNYVILGKDKLDILAYSDHPDYGHAYGASVQASSSQYKDSITFDNLKTVISTQHPKLAIVNFPGTDRAGHDGPWSNYVSKLQYADSLINEFWNLIQNDPVYQNKTTVFITNDHGRHLDGIADGFRGHGDGCDGCRHISLLVMGPDTPPGIIDTTMRTQIDIAPTVALLLNFNTTESVGTIITSAINFELPQTTISYVSSGWNLLSIPIRLNNHAKTSIYPSASSDAFRYISSVGYQSEDTLKNNIGYWLKFSEPESIAFTGYFTSTDTIDLVSGWNLIGSISQDISVSAIAMLPPEMGYSSFFGYDNGYHIADTLKPFRGYWIKVNQNGKLILSK
jgi:hypothetical protein